MTSIKQLESELEAHLASLKTCSVDDTLNAADRKRKKDANYQYMKRFKEKKQKLESDIAKLKEQVVYSVDWQPIVHRINSLLDSHSNKSTLQLIVSKTHHISLSPATLNISNAFKIRPEIDHVFCDILATKKPIIYQSSLAAASEAIKDDEFDACHLIKSVFAEGDQCLCAFDIPATDHGLSTCKVRAIDCEGHHHLDLTSVTNAIGYTTLPHIDSSLRSSCIFMVKGEKLWYSWPYTQHNAAIWTLNMPFVECIDRLEGLSITLVKDGEGLIVKAAKIHAVILLTNACLVGYRIYSDFRASMERTEMYLKMLDSQELEKREAVLTRLRDTSRDLEFWQQYENVPTADMHQRVNKVIRKYERTGKNRMEAIMRVQAGELKRKK